MDTIRIRRAVKKDLEQLLGFEQELISAERPMDPTIREDPVCYYDLRTIISDPDYALVVGEMDGKLIASGYATVKRARSYLNHGFYAYLGFMYTVPQYRGQGINRKIIKELHAWARQKGLKELRLTVYDQNAPAIRAYEKAGFGKHIVEMRLLNSNL